jgi:hypothetical protein
MIARKQQISLQLNQLIDALLLGGVFWLRHFLRSTKLAALDSLEDVPGFAFIFLRLDVHSRSVLTLPCLAAPAALLLKERIYIAHRTMRLRRGGTGERIILAGEADKAHKFLRGFFPSQRLEIQVIDIVDLEHLGTEALVDAIHRDNVGRVIPRFNRIELDKARRAVETGEVD